MDNSSGYREQRRESRINSERSVMVSIGTQLTFKGQLRDLSVKSAFIRIRESIFLQPGDEVMLEIQCPSNNEDEKIHGLACVSRIVAGEGFAVYFIKMDKASTNRLEKLVNTPK